MRVLAMLVGLLACVAAQAVPVTLDPIGWRVVRADSQETKGENGAAANAVDLSLSTRWHTQWVGASPPPPHEIVIDLGANYAVSGLTYLPRRDGSQNGWVKEYQFYVSTDGSNWGLPAMAGAWDWTDGAKQKEVLFNRKVGRYVRFVALSEVHGNPWTSMAGLVLVGELVGAAPTPGLTSAMSLAGLLFFDPDWPGRVLLACEWSAGRITQCTCVP
jgi:hypothetical protein